jgi:CBS-domain-containing membrane protein
VRLPQINISWTIILKVAAGAAGGAAAIALMEVLAERTTVPLLFVPFATSIVLVMGSPEAEPAQPRALVGGHLVSAAVGLLLLQVTGPGPCAAAAQSASRSLPCMQPARFTRPPVSTHWSS